jgi:glycosyltransferase involved in cell wall biosynthesis
MACGLPILSGSNVGAAEELVDDGVNGWKFDAGNAEELAQLMAKISDFRFPILDLRAAGVEILEKRCPTRAFGNGLSGLLTPDS